MTRRVPACEYRPLVGRSLLTLANVITAAAPIAADWNDSHIFNDRWPAHARFHGVTALAMATSLSAANVWSVWSGAADRDAARFFAAAVPVAYWAPFFLAPLVPGTGVDDPPHPVGRLAGGLPTCSARRRPPPPPLSAGGWTASPVTAPAQSAGRAGCAAASRSRSAALNGTGCRLAASQRTVTTRACAAT